MSLNGKTYLVYGTGISGIAAAELLILHKKQVILYEENTQVKPEMIINRSPLLKNAKIWIGQLDENKIRDVDMVILSPGVPLDIPNVALIKKKKIPIWGEIELAFACAKGRILAISGTNGKTTTTALLGEILKKYYQDVKVVGNIGIPFTSIAADTTKESIIVAEVSSFQLETIKKFRPDVSAILNITPDHLNRHYTMENYSSIKLMLTMNQQSSDVCILNYDDERLRSFQRDIRAKTIYFSSEKELEEGMFLKDNEIVFRRKDIIKSICNINELQLIGQHNYENMMAAALMAISFGVPIDKIKEELVRFKGVEHRIEYVTMKRGIRFYNDSKGTNPDAAIRGIKSMRWPTYLIGGGYDKQSNYEPWIEAFDGKVKKLVLIGATKEKIADTAVKCGFNEIIFANDMEEAVTICYENAKEGDAVLLSPACASWGMFKDYNQRGDRFKEIVNNLKE